ncbi:MAG: LysM peptidoglycan-binding domain-containing protein [Anaerolineaceae bacterium]|nr:LysM peptidoglycan-binding domain-containing protein [Anaerolineaceae bacterium]
MPEITLSLPVALGLLALILIIGAVFVYIGLNSTGSIAKATQTPSPSQTPTITLTPSASLTPTIAPTWTPLPPIEYTIAAGDSCISIAVAFNVSVTSIILENKLPASCSPLTIGNKLRIPQPTQTATAAPTNTLSDVEATDAACQKLDYTVQMNDTLSGISDMYDVSQTAIKEYNGLVSDVVREGQVIKIPLCMRAPTAGPSPTPTTPPLTPGPTCSAPLMVLFLPSRMMWLRSSGLLLEPFAQMKLTRSLLKIRQKVLVVSWLSTLWIPLSMFQLRFVHPQTSHMPCAGGWS